MLVARRNFYGVLSVTEYGGADSEDLRRNLYNGRILHGVQFRQPDKRRIPTTYYTPESGVGLALVNMAVAGPLRVATVGLGTGTIAAYGQQGDYYCFYEINPEVEEIAQTVLHVPVATVPADGRGEAGRRAAVDGATTVAAGVRCDCAGCFQR